MTSVELMEKYLQLWNEAETDEEKINLWKDFFREGKNLEGFREVNKKFSMTIFQELAEICSRIREQRSEEYKKNLEEATGKPIWIGDLNKSEAEMRWAEIKKKHRL